jgi:hypothetical protein
VESIRMSDQSIPVLINTDATLVMGMLSSELPKNRGLIRNTRSGLTSMRVGKRRLPRVQRLALNTLLAVDVRGAVDITTFYLARMQLDDRAVIHSRHEVYRSLFRHRWHLTSCERQAKDTKQQPLS